MVAALDSKSMANNWLQVFSVLNLSAKAHLARVVLSR
jgi:hypothetical protein